MIPAEGEWSWDRLPDASDRRSGDVQMMVVSVGPMFHWRAWKTGDLALSARGQASSMTTAKIAAERWVISQGLDPVLAAQHAYAHAMVRAFGK